jgi:hypothetical protein
MIHDLYLRPAVHKDRHLPTSDWGLVFKWDEAAGIFSGRDARTAREMVEAARESGFVAIEPHPSSHRVSRQPTRCRADIAAIFGQWYALPEWLESARPVGKGAANDEAGDAGRVY